MLDVWVDQHMTFSLQWGGEQALWRLLAPGRVRWCLVGRGPCKGRSAGRGQDEMWSPPTAAAAAASEIDADGALAL